MCYKAWESDPGMTGKPHASPNYNFDGAGEEQCKTPQNHCPKLEMNVLMGLDVSVGNPGALLCRL